MSAETDLIKLYSGQILQLASSIPHTERLSAPTATARRRSPLCGSTVTVDIVVDDGRITQYGQDVKACALGQAAASVVAGGIIGCDRATVERARDQLRSMLKEDGAAPEPPFAGLEVLRPARDYKNRHSSILLSLEATLEAFENVSTPA